MLINLTTSPDAYGDATPMLIVDDLRRTGFDKVSIVVVPEGQSGRQEFGGPDVPGPWAFTTTHANVIDAYGMAAAERAAAPHVPVNMPLHIDGLPGTWALTHPNRRMLDGDGAQLVPLDDDAYAVATPKQRRRIEAGVTA